MLQFCREYPSLLVGKPQPQEPKNQSASLGDPISPPLVAKLDLIDKKELRADYAIAQTPSAPFSDGSSNEEIGQEATIPTEEVDKINPIVQQLVAQLPWTHNTILIQSVKDMGDRLWYMQQTIEQGWSRSILQQMIKSAAHLRQAKAFTNFEASLPAPQSDLALQTLKDPYIFDFLTLDTTFRERELEAGLLQFLERFLLELGKGFSFIGRQFQLSVGDDQLRHDTDNPTIGLILCQDKKKILAEYALRGMKKPIGISEYELTRALPQTLKSALPTIEEIEQSLGPFGGKKR